MIHPITLRLKRLQDAKEKVEQHSRNLIFNVIERGIEKVIQQVKTNG
jgi:hypothetical protein